MSISDDFPPVDHARLRWDTSSKLGEGSFGIVYRGLYDANPVAIKVIKRPSSSVVSAAGDRVHQSAALRQHRREIDRYHVVRNQYIILYLGSFRGDDPRDLYIVTEYLEGGSLHDSLVQMRQRHAVLDEFSFLTIASHIARGLLHVHNQQLTHGDMKPQNVLLTSAIQFKQHATGGSTAYLPANAKVKLADFGLSKRLEGAVSPHLFGSTAATADFGTGAVGTFLYMSPEAYKGIGTLSDDSAKASDIYAYGLVLFELLSGLQSWRLEGVRNLFDLMLLVSEGNRPSWGPRKDHIDPRYIQFVEECWRQEPTERPKIQDVVDQIDVLLESYRQRLSMRPTDTAAQWDNGTHSSSERPASGRQGHVRRDPSDHSLPTEQTQANAPYDPVDVQDIPNGLGDSSGSESSDGGGKNSLLGVSDRFARKNNETKSTTRVDKKPSSGSYNEDLHSKSIDSNPYTDDQGFDLLDAPALVHVESRKLTASEVRDGRHQPSGLGQYGPDSTAVSDKDSQGTDGSITADISTLGIAKDEIDIDNQRDEIDDNVAEVVMLQHVKSARIPKPQVDDLEIQGLVDDRKPVLGLGSVANEERVGDSPMRSNTDMLNSFASPFSGAKFAESKAADECESNDSEKFSRVSQAEDMHKASNEVTRVEMEKHDHNPHGAVAFPSINIDAVMAEPLRKFPSRPPTSSHSSASSSKGTTPDYPEKRLSPEKKTKNSYSSPENIEIEPKVLSELEQNDKGAFDESTVSGDNQVVSQGGTASVPTQAAPSDPGHLPSFTPTPHSDHASSQPLRKDYLSTQSAWNLGFNAEPRIQNGANHEAIRPSISQPEMLTSYQIPPYVPSFHNVQHSTPYGSFVNPAIPGSMTPSAYGSLSSQGASAPPLSDTSQSALGGTSSHQRISPGMQTSSTPSWPHVGASQPIPSTRLYPQSASMDVNGAIRNVSPHVSALLYALRRPDGIAVADEMWRHGDRRWVAEALSLYPSRGGESMMVCAARFLGMNNDLPPDRKDPHIAIHLCTAIGNFARNDPQAMNRKCVISLLRTVLLVMPNFCNMSEGKVQVFSACCYALSNLFKICNVITDTRTRSIMADWIEYAISYNISNESPNGGQFSDSLAYNAACAARNFMWMNEDNVQAFVTCSPHADSGRGPPVTELIESMRVFAIRGRLFVVESSLSALAMIILYPRQRVQFIHRHGFKVFFETLQYHPCQPSTVSLVFWMITTMFSEPVTSAKESEAFWNAFVIDQGSHELVRAITHVRRGIGSEKERLELLEHGFYAILAVVRFNSSMRGSLINSGCMQHVHSTLTDIANSGAVGVQNVDKALVTQRTRLGTVLCDVVKELGADASGYSYLRDNNMRRTLEDLLRAYGSDGTFGHSCRNAIAMLPY